MTLSLLLQCTLATLLIYEIQWWQMQMIVSEINLIQQNTPSVLFNPKSLKGQHSKSDEEVKEQLVGHAVMGMNGRLLQLRQLEQWSVCSVVFDQCNTDMPSDGAVLVSGQRDDTAVCRTITQP